MGRTGSAILVRSVEAALLGGEETESTGLPGLPGLRLRCFAAEAARACARAGPGASNGPRSESRDSRSAHRLRCGSIKQARPRLEASISLFFLFFSVFLHDHNQYRA